METPTINVNLGDCYSYCQADSYPPRQHETHCPALPVLVPLSLEPWRTVTMKVRLGDERTGQCVEFDIAPGQKEDDADAMCRCGYPRGDHEVLTDEPARPIEVTCSITGKTWADSEVTNVETRDDTWHPSAPRYYRALSAAQDRWALIKALVTGEALSPTYTLTPDAAAIVNQRDAVFSALCEMVRAEQTAYEAEVSWGLAMGSPARDDVRHPDPGFDANILPSQRRLSTYIGRLIEQVGSLT